MTSSATVVLPAWIARGSYQRRIITEGHKPGVIDGDEDRRRYKSTLYRLSRQSLAERLAVFGVELADVTTKEGRTFQGWTQDGKAVKLELA